MKQTILHLFIGLTAVILSSCASKTADVETHALPLHHATLLHLQEADSFVVAQITDPWHPNQNLAQYVLVPRQQPLPHQLPQGTLVRTPITRAALTTTVHAALLLELNKAHAMAALTDTNYVVSPSLKHYLRQRKSTLCDAGQSMAPNAERLRAAKVDAVCVSPFENAGNGAIEHLGVPLIQCADYMEATPLGRAEWIKFYGLLFGCKYRADSLFGEIEKTILPSNRKPKLFSKPTKSPP